MKKLLLLTIVISIMLYGITYCFASEPDYTTKLLNDLTLIEKYDSKDNIENEKNYINDMEGLLTIQKVNLNILYSYYYLGYYNGSFNSKSLKECFDFDINSFNISPLYNNEFYERYYKMRTESVLKNYTATGQIDFNNFYSSGTRDFKSFKNSVLTDKKSMEKLIILIQEKLCDKLPEIESSNRKYYIDEIISLRNPQNYEKSLEIIFQFWEYRVRLEVLNEIAKLNNDELYKMSENMPLYVTSSKDGTIQLIREYDDKSTDIVQLINSECEVDAFKCKIILQEFYKGKDFKIKYVTPENNEIIYESDTIFSGIYMNENNYLVLDIDKLQMESLPIEKELNKVDNNELKNLYLINSIKAQAIIKELNRFSQYKELKDNKINNNFTRKFETEKILWKKNLEQKLDTFDKSGTADFLIYIKSFEMLNRNVNRTEQDRILITKFRNTDLQFRKTDEGLLWMIDMLYKFNFF